MSTSPFHAGERALQARLGLEARMDGIGRRVIRDHLPDQHRAFYAQLPFLVVGSVDAAGDPWASLVVGPPGFLSTPDAVTLDVAAHPEAPLAEHLVPGAPLGLLGIELHTRRRNRASGHVHAVRTDGFTVAITQTVGNCPQYIHPRHAEVVRPADDARPRAVQRSTHLDAEAEALIAQADTAFVASWAPPAPDEPARGADVSHRGGDPGFLQVEDPQTLLVPDYAGNNLYMTLGNLAVYPRAGLTIVDFASGDLLQLTGAAELVWDPETVGRLPGAERAWRLRITRAVWRRDALPLRWR